MLRVTQKLVPAMPLLLVAKVRRVNLPRDFAAGFSHVQAVDIRLYLRMRKAARVVIFRDYVTCGHAHWYIKCGCGWPWSTGRLTKGNN